MTTNLFRVKSAKKWDQPNATIVETIAKKMALYMMKKTFVIVIGLLSILRGLGLGIPFISPEPVIELVSSNIDCIN
ncbi:hypothetical protein [Sediminicola sp. 1XM1-17]|uniref:hypothetical protein n=1 Tax=Sediminicola sp. 1XM1-17 TaxID=3127702 RepID=UPI00307877E3